MDKIAQQDLEWAKLMAQLEHECSFDKNQFLAIAFGVAAPIMPAEKKIEIVEGIIKFISNHKSK